MPKNSNYFTITRSVFDAEINLTGTNRVKGKIACWLFEAHSAKVSVAQATRDHKWVAGFRNITGRRM